MHISNDSNDANLTVTSDVVRVYQLVVCADGY